MRARLVPLLSLLVAACGGTAPADAPASETTAGGEEIIAVLQEDPSLSEHEEDTEPAVLRSTIPVPVPQPAVRRERLSTALQAVWTRVEEQVSVRRPAGPEEETVENVQAWANGPFYQWVQARRRHLEETRELLVAVPDDPPHERAVALALFAYAFEDFGAQIAGAPVPADIAADDELRSIYVRSLNEATVPVGQRAMELYADCQQRLVRLGDDSPWLPWRAYCVQRGQQIIEGYGLAPTPSTNDAPQPSP
jgi:hypothetical protein